MNKPVNLPGIEVPPPGMYVVGLSGGMDSVVLLNALAGQSQLQLVAAHFDHAWSEQSEQGVGAARTTAEGLGLPFEAVRRPVPAREAESRAARYAYLREVAARHNADAILTGHHQSDLIETMYMNLQRGTGRRGLVPFGAAGVLRPLAGVAKADIVAYASEHQLAWVEDASNANPAYLRNQVRTQVLPALMDKDPDLVDYMVGVSNDAAALNRRIDAELAASFDVMDTGVRSSIAQLRRMSLAHLAETIMMMARSVQPGCELDSRTVEALALDLKSGRFRRSRRLTKQLFAHPAHGTVTIVFTP